jgi:glucose/arabinose dehydrogenase
MLRIFSRYPVIAAIVIFSCDNMSKNINGGDGREGKTETIAQKPEGDIRIQTSIIAGRLTSPVGVENAGDGSNRLFVVEQPGVVKVFKNGKILQKPFLDIQHKIVKQFNAYSERGLLGLAFHPDYKTNGRFFVYYSAPTEMGGDHKSVIAEYKVSADADIAEAGSEKIIMETEQPEGNHNGGQLAFGPDGYLYIGLGDGGGAGDRHGEIGNAQNLTTLLGKILRIDINNGKPYAIPTDNPFKGANEKKEIFAYGLRNPWRFSFDKNGRLFCGDVGQNKYEEIDIIEKGKNYGWRYREGNHEFDPKLKDLTSHDISPVYEYDRSFGISVTGGYVYQGNALKNMKDKYIFGDWNGRVACISPSGGKWKAENITLLNVPEIRINSFGKDENGEIYIACQEKVGAKSPTGMLIKLVSVE